MDDHVSKVLSALAVVGTAKLVGGVNGEIQRRPGGREGCRLSCGSGFLRGGHGLHLGGHACVVVVFVIVFFIVGNGNILGVVVQLSSSSPSERTREENM